jgi:DNA polymerase III sliding clamp (beta) subunit (PCNA family)
MIRGFLFCTLVSVALAAPEEVQITVPSIALREAIAKTALLTTNRRAEHPVLNSTELSFRSNQLQLVSTDAWRISFAVIAVTNSTRTEPRLIVDTDFLRSLHKFLTREGSVVIRVSAAKAEFDFAGERRSTPPLAFAYPDWRVEVVGKQPHQLTFPKREAVRLLLGITVDSARMKTSGDRLSFFSPQNRPLGSLRLDKAVAPALELMVNLQFLMDFAKHVEGGTIELGYTDSPMKPIRLQAPGEPNFIYYLMPKKLD